uniref:Selenoprotein O n=1 Tax=Podarcis muralis TaxID=64176 RepID=A0A670JBN3_PODMU
MEGEQQQEMAAEPAPSPEAQGDGPKEAVGIASNISDADALKILLEMKMKRRKQKPSLPSTVTELSTEEGSKVYVVGTAHFSDSSKRDVVKTIQEVQPDVVVVELCQYRVSMLKMDEKTLLKEAKEINLEKLQQAIKQNGVMSGLMQMLLLKVSAHITEQLGMAPGGEFREAFKEASKVPFCKFHLGDRPIPVTFKRAIAALSFWQKVKLAWGLCFLSDPIRQADGRKVLRSSIREFLCSEAMFHLGIPTTRAGTCVTSDSEVIRDIFYDGNPKKERCTIVLRIAPTFIRFGSFEIFKATDEYTGRKGPSVDRNDIRIQMLDYVISTFYPEILQAHSHNNVQRNAAFFREVTRRTARMVAEWQCVGFCHGVLNTDNMSIVGLTIDYGPFGFMDRYDPEHICNGSDNSGRYAYNKQPEICKWNLGKLAEALVPELPLEISIPILEEEYEAEFERHYLQTMRKKLGLIQLRLDDDNKLVSDLLETMRVTGADFTNTFRLLSSFPADSDPLKLEEFLDKISKQCASLEELKVAYKPQMDPRQLSMMLMLAQSNPQLFALIGTKSNINKELERIEQFSKLQQLTASELVSRNKGHWKDWLQNYRVRLEKEMEQFGNSDNWSAEHVKIMNSNNPKYILRNYIAQNAIEAAENGDFMEVRKVLRLLEKPYEEDLECYNEATEGPEVEEVGAAAAECSSASRRRVPYSSKPPLWASELCVT